MTHQEGQQKEEDSPLEVLRTSLRGDVLLPGTPEYEKAIIVWNWDLKRKPQAIFKVLGVSDVQKVLKFISTSHTPPLPFTVKCGGHSMRCLCDGYVIDLSKMRGCRVDKETQTAQVEGGALLADVYKETAAYDLFLPAGVVSHTGVGGLALFGGVGWLCREFGLTCDHILEVDVVTADGELRVVNKDQHPDLFWGMRGAGPCFGVVTSFKFRLIQTTNVYAGPMLFPWQKYTELFEVYRQYTLSEDSFTRKEYCGMAATHVNGTKMASFVSCHHGSEEEWTKNHESFSKLGPVFTNLQERTTVDWFCGNDRNSPHGYWYEKGMNLNQISPEIGPIIAEAFEHAPTTHTTVLLLPFGGKINDVPLDETAYCSRKSRFGINIEVRWDGAEEKEREKEREAAISWARALYAKLSPFKSNTTYINFDVDDVSAGGREYFGKHFERLQELKQKYDPNGIFRSIVTP